MEHPYPQASWTPEGAEEGTYLYDDARAQRVINFIEKLCVHPKGRMAGKPFILLDWEREIVQQVFGTVRWSEDYQEYVRQYRLAWIEIARKNGKSSFAAAVGLYLLCADGEAGAEIYMAAKDREQASIIYATAKDMVYASPVLSKRLKVLDSKKRIVDSQTSSWYQVLASDSDGALGTNPSAVFMDEVVAQPNRNLWDALATGQGARKQPLFFAITTAGYTTARFCLEEHEQSVKVQESPLMDPARYVFMRNTPMDVEWDDESVWAWANPSIGHSISVEWLRDMARSARNRPQEQNTFRAFNLNQWVTQETRWIDANIWKRSNAAGGPVIEELLKGRKCFGGLDLSSTSDLTTWALLFPGTPTDAEAPGWTVLLRTWLPRGAVEKRSKMQASLSQWEVESWITVLDGDYIDYDQIEAQIYRDNKDFNIQMVGYDKWNAAQLIAHLEAEGINCVTIGQTIPVLNGPTKEFERLVVEEKLYAGYNPVLEWNVGNAQLYTQADSGMVRISKKTSADKIDAVAATINALAVAILPEVEQVKSEFISLW